MRLTNGKTLVQEAEDTKNNLTSEQLSTQLAAALLCARGRYLGSLGDACSTISNNGPILGPTPHLLPNYRHYMDSWTDCQLHLHTQNKWSLRQTPMQHQWTHGTTQHTITSLPYQLPTTRHPSDRSEYSTDVSILDVTSIASSNLDSEYDPMED